jgi:hypothetical protein
VLLRQQDTTLSCSVLYRPAFFLFLHCCRYVWPRLKFYGESPWLLLPVAVRLQVAQCKSTSQRLLPALRAHVYVDSLHLALTTFKLNLLLALASEWAAQISSTSAGGNTSAASAVVDDTRVESSDPILTPVARCLDLPRRYNVVARVQVETMLVTLSQSAPQSKAPVDLPGGSSATTPDYEQTDADSGMHWVGIDYSRISGRFSTPLLSLSASRLRVLCDMNSDGLETSVSLGSLHVWDLLRVRSSGWMTFSAQTRARGGNAATRVAPIHPLQWCQLLSCSPPLRPRHELAHSPPSRDDESRDSFLTVRVLLYSSPALSPAEVCADVALGNCAVVLNRDLLAALIRIVPTLTVSNASTAPVSQTPVNLPPSVISNKSGVASEAVIDDGSGLLLSGPCVREILAIASSSHTPSQRFEHIAPGVRGVHQKLVRASSKRRSMQATVQLSKFTVVLNSETAAWSSFCSQDPVLPSHLQGNDLKYLMAALSSDIDTLVTGSSDFGWGGCEVNQASKAERGYLYRGPLASLTISGVVIATTIDDISTTASLQVHSVSLDDLTFEPVGSHRITTPGVSRDFVRRHVHLLTMKVPIAGASDEGPSSSFDVRQKALRMCPLPLVAAAAGAGFYRATEASFSTNAASAAGGLAASPVLPVLLCRDDSSFDADLVLASNSPAMAREFFSWTWSYCTDAVGRVVQGCCGSINSQTGSRELLGNIGT